MKTLPLANRRFLALALAAAIATFLLVVSGNAVRVMDAAQACPGWPTCFGGLTFFPIPTTGPVETPAAAQMAHRGLAALASLLTAAAAGWAALRMRANRLVTVPLLAGGALMLTGALLGSGVSRAENPALSATHLILALGALAAVTAAVTAAFAAARPGRLAFRSPFARLTLAALAALFLLMLSGTLVTANGAAQSCQGWPLCDGGLPRDGLGLLALAHRGVVAAAGLLLAAQFAAAWRSQRSQAAALTAATAVFVFVVGQSFIGALSAQRGLPADLVGLHAAAAAGMWAAQIILVVSAGLAGRSAQEEAAEAAALPAGARAWGRRLLDFVILSKPIIVLLLLVTTYAGMVVGGRAIPSAALTFWTLLGGALAAGGSSALNQFIDRDTDKDMQRTANRPIPGGRLQPAEGLAYGLGACLAAFFLLAGTVNLLAAVLSLAGMIYYVLIYSVWLKHLTVQNIVIGGGAGAIPPLVGWAAATGSLNVPALFLFAIIFLWTPPHFWALALVRRKDYARGRVPMLPVIRGEAETRKQILIYTFQLVALTLLMPALGIAGTVYLVSAAALGLWLISTAWKVYKDDGNKMAWKMYRYSSMYLMFLMIAMVVDVLM